MVPGRKTDQSILQVYLNQILRFRVFIPGIMLLIIFTNHSSYSGQIQGNGTGYRNNTGNISPDSILIRKIILEGNHITKDKIILRELLFRENQSVEKSKAAEMIEQSRKNLLNTSLFNFVNIDTVQVPGEKGVIDVTIEFTERWYIWPIPILHFADRNFNAWLEKKDWTRLNYGMYLTVNNFRGRKERLIFYTQFGYDENYNILYQVPYIDRKQRIGLAISGGFMQNHEVQYMTIDNKPEYYKADERPMKNIFSYAEITYRKGIHHSHRAKVQFNYYNFSDSLFHLNHDFAFDNQNVNRFFSFEYQFKSDFRDSKAYPLKGSYFDFGIEKKGLGFLQEPEVNSLTVTANLRKYFRFNNKFYFASGISIKSTPSSHEPYYFQKGLGYHRDFVRGYEYYIVDGGHFGILKTNLKYELISPRVRKLHLLNTEKFNKIHYAGYLSAFFDLGYSDNTYFKEGNDFSDRLLPGWGIGFDFVTYYDLVIRVEYSMNHLFERGLFIHFMASI